MNITLKQKAIELRHQGKSLSIIAEIIGKSISQVGRYVKGIKPNCHPLYKTKEIQHDFFSQTNVELDPDRLTLAGFIAADGCISQTNGQDTLHIRLCHKDRQVLEIFNELLSKNTRKISVSKKSQVITFPSEQISQDLSFYGIVPRKTKTLDWPKFNSLQHAKKFLLGYFYGDGCFHEYHNRPVIHFVSTTNFAINLRQYLLENNIVEHCVVSKLKNKNYSQTVFQGKHAIKLSNWMFHEIKYPLLPRKHPTIF